MAQGETLDSAAGRADASLSVNSVTVMTVVRAIVINRVTREERPLP